MEEVLELGVVDAIVDEVMGSVVDVVVDCSSDEAVELSEYVVDTFSPLSEVAEEDVTESNPGPKDWVRISSFSVVISY